MATRGTSTIDFAAVLPVGLDVYPEGYPGRRSDVACFLHRSGWLVVHEARLEMSFTTWRRKILTCVSDHGEVYSQWTAGRLLSMPTSLPKDPDVPPPEELEEMADALWWDFLGWTDQMNLRALQEAEAARDERIHDIEYRCEAMIDRLEERLRTLAQERRDPASSPERRRTIAGIAERLVAGSTELVTVCRRRTLELRAETDALEEEVFEALEEATGDIECLAVVRWQAKRTAKPTVLRHMPPLAHHFDLEAWRHRRLAGISNGIFDVALVRDSNGF